MKWFFSIILLLLLLVVIAVYKAPASLVPMALLEADARGLLQQGGPRLRLAVTSGTVWRGQAEQAELEIEGGVLPLGKLTWQLSALSLLEKKPALQLHSEAGTHRLRALVSGDQQGEITVRAMEGQLPIKLLEPWIPMLVKGDIAFVVDHMKFNQRQMLALDGVLNLEYVDWMGGDYPMPLGSYMAQLSLGESSEVLIHMSDYGASLGIDGVWSISPDGRYIFDARLELREGLSPEVAQSIAWFGKRDNHGNILVKSRGRL